MRRAILLLSSLALLFGLSTADAGAHPASFDGISANGKIVVFSTKDQLVPGDTDQEVDVYERAFDQTLGEYVTREVSIGPSGGNDTLPAQYDGMSSNGEEVFFSTKERLVAADRDHVEDVYVRLIGENRTILVSQGAGSNQGEEENCAPQNCGSGEAPSSFVQNGVSAEGGKVFFATNEALTKTDKDEAVDIYVRDLQAETTTLVSAAGTSCGLPNCGQGSAPAQFAGTDRTGDKAFFTTTEGLVNQDTDSSPDIYERNLTTKATRLVSLPGTCPSAELNCNPTFRSASADGSHVFFETNERLTESDTDSSQDVYDWSGGTAALVSTAPGAGNGAFDATFAGASANGATVYFETNEALDPADTDHVQDVYQRSGGVTTLVSAGAEGRGNAEVPASFAWASPDGSSEAVFFSSSEALTGEDTDSAQDVYMRLAGVTTLLSTGPEGSGGNFDATFAGASADGSKVFFTTAEPLSAEDLDTTSDIYLRSAAGTQLISVGPVGGNGPAAATPRAVAADGSRAFFVTTERLTGEDDFAGEEDVYGWSPAGAVLVSVKNSPDLVLGPPPPALEAMSPASPGSSLQPAIIGQSVPGAEIKIYTTFDCSGEIVAQGTAQELASPGLSVEIPVVPGSTTSYRATAEAEGIVSVCSSPISYTQKEPAPPPPPTEGGTSGPPSGGGTAGSGAGGSAGGAQHGGVTYVTPLVRITFGPAAKTRQRRPVFRFLDATEQPGTRFFCRVDKQRWQGCGSPIKVRKLRFGRHIFALKAVNAVGTPGPRPVQRAFRVVAP
jgi:hypothetical protein